MTALSKVYVLYKTFSTKEDDRSSGDTDGETVATQSVRNKTDRTFDRRASDIKIKILHIELRLIFHLFISNYLIEFPMQVLGRSGLAFVCCCHTVASLRKEKLYRLSCMEGHNVSSPEALNH